MILYRQHLARGFVWLGSASLAAKVVDALTGVILLGLLSKRELGISTMAWTATTFAEAFNGFGVGTAIVQARTVSARTAASAHWYAVAINAGLVLLLYSVAPLIAVSFRMPELVFMVRVSACKLLFVGLAHVPLALGSRDLRFERLGAIASTATLLSSVITVALAALGLGAWAPLLGNTAHGVFQWLGASLLVPFFPRPQLAWQEVRPLATTGWNLTAAGATGQVARNLDYVLLGWIGGADALGSYRIAFELAMAPTQAVLQVAHRFALPVYARVAEAGSQLAAAVVWAARSTLLIVCAPLLFSFLFAEDLLLVLGKTSGGTTVAALRLLCCAAFLRALAQAPLTVMVAMGRSRLVLLEALASAFLLGGSLALCSLLLRGVAAEVRLAAGWALAYMVLAPLELVVVRTFMPGVVVGVLRSARAPLLVTGAAGLLSHVIARLLPLDAGAPRLLVHGTITAVLYAAGARRVWRARDAELDQATQVGEEKRAASGADLVEHDLVERDDTSPGYRVRRAGRGSRSWL